MPENIVTLLINNQRVTGWDSVNLVKSIEKISGGFTFTIVNEDEKNLDFINTQELAQIYIDDDLIITGYIDTITPSVGKDSSIMNIAGREKIADLVDCAAINKPGTWKNIKLLRLLDALLKPFPPPRIFDIDVHTALSLETKIKKFSINTGDSVFESISKACALLNVLPSADPEGNLVIVDSGETSPLTDDNLVYGVNIKSAEGSTDFSGRYSEYSVKGNVSSPGSGWGGGSGGIKVFGEATDEVITRFRPFQKRADENVTNDLAKKQAAWEAQIRAGKSQRITVTVPEWRQSTDTLWSVNHRVPVRIEPLRADAIFLIVSVAFNLSNTGRTVTMDLAPPDIFQPEPKPVVKAKTGSGWS